MRYDPTNLPAEVIEFLTERHLATLSIVKPDGTPQVTPVGFTYDTETATARVITWADSYKAKLVGRMPGTTVAVSQVDGGRWLTVTGKAILHSSGPEIAEGVSRYAGRYRQPKERDNRVVVSVQVTDVVGRVPSAD